MKKVHKSYRVRAVQGSKQQQKLILFVHEKCVCVCVCTETESFDSLKLWLLGAGSTIWTLLLYFVILRLLHY